MSKITLITDVTGQGDFTNIIPLDRICIGVIGLGYVGLPLCVEFGKKYKTLGYDVDENRVQDLTRFNDRTGEVSLAELRSSSHLRFSNSDKDLEDCNIFIITVPTPVDESKEPDLSPLISASKLVGRYIKDGSIVIYESTVYPGVTEETCGPILEDVSGLTLNSNFYLGYSPERIVPGDKSKNFKDILKITSGSTVASAQAVDALYGSVVSAGTYCAENIKTAEAAKVIENIQRDVNIALINEFSLIFSKLGIDTNEVINAASTKWNFIDLRPGLVGGHCIGIDPYYLIHQAKQKGHIPDLIMTARKINEKIPFDISQKYLDLVGRYRGYVGSKCLIVGATFKSDCNDLRNSKVKNVIETLIGKGVSIDIFDEVANYDDLKNTYGDIVIDKVDETLMYDGIILCVDHTFVREKSIDYWRSLMPASGCLLDVKAVYPRNETDFRL